MVTLFIAAELFSQKLNLEVPFPSIPTLSELTRVTENLFNVEMSFMRPEGHPVYPFRVSKFKLYDDVTLRWLDVVSELQLTHNSQLYAFQVENPYHRESQRELPNPTKPRAYIHQSPPALRTLSNSVIPMSVAAPIISVPRSDASLAEKLRVVFDDIDSNKDSVIGMDEMRQSFATLGLNFSSATVSDLFLKGDENRDGMISYAEFERFAQRYPIMLDCMYYHSRAFWDSPQLRDELARAHEASERARRSAEDARAGQTETQRGLDDRSLRLDSMDRDMADLTRRIADMQSQFDTVTRDRDSLQRDRSERERQLQALTEQQRTAIATQQQLRRDLEKAVAKSQASVLEVRRGEERIQQLQQQLTEAQRALDRAKALQIDAERESGGIKDRESRTSEQVVELNRAVTDCESLYRRTDEGLRGITDKERDLDGKLRSNQRHLEELKYQRDNEARAVEAMRVQLRQREQQHQDAIKSLEDNERRARETEAELLEFQKQKQKATESERTLVEQEVRLREQRECLEMKETALMREANVVVTAMKDNSQMRSPPRGRSSYGGR
eukprot:PhF_6_TR40985/c0_g1_i2/m.62081